MGLCGRARRELNVEQTTAQQNSREKTSGGSTISPKPVLFRFAMFGVRNRRQTWLYSIHLFARLGKRGGSSAIAAVVKLGSVMSVIQPYSSSREARTGNAYRVFAPDLAGPSTTNSKVLSCRRRKKSSRNQTECPFFELRASLQVVGGRGHRYGHRVTGRGRF